MSHADELPQVFPEISLAPMNGSVTVEGFVSASETVEVATTLSVLRKMADGSHLESRQSQTVQLGPEKGPVSVGALGVNLDAGSVLSAGLIVSVDDVVVSEARTQIGPDR